MTLPPVGSHVTQPADVVLNNSTRVVLDCHGRQLGREGGDGLCGQGADTRLRMDGELGQNPRRQVRTDRVELLERFLFAGNGVA